MEKASGIRRRTHLPYRFLIGWLISVWLMCLSVQASETEEAEAVLTALGEELDLQEAQQSLDELLGKELFSLSEAVGKLIKGELPWNGETVKKILEGVFLSEIQQYRKMAAYLFVLILMASLFHNFILAFEKRQIAEISYETLYLLMITLLMKVFSNMNQTAANAVETILKFMEALIPACMMTLYLSAGSVTAMGFYQMTLWATAGVQWIFCDFLLPGVQLYVILLFLNQLMKEDYLSKMAELIKTGILWCLKTATALLFGMQAIRYIAAPAVDQVKTATVNKALSAIPGIGGAYETLTETVLGAAVVLKNAVGLAGMSAIFFLGLIPVLKLACGVLLYWGLGAAAQPVTDKRVAECISSVAEGGQLLMKIVLYASLLFVISLAVIAVMVRGG